MKFSDSVKAVEIRTYQLALEMLEDRLTPGETMGAALPLSSFVCPYLALLGADMLRQDAPAPVVNSTIVADAAPQATVAQAVAAPAAPVATVADTSDSATPVKNAVANPPMDDSAAIQSTPLTPSTSDASMSTDLGNDGLTADPSTLDASPQLDANASRPTAQNEAGTLLNGNALMGGSGSGLASTPMAPVANGVAASTPANNSGALQAAAAAAASSAAPAGTSSPMLVGAHSVAAPANGGAHPLNWSGGTAPPYTPAQIEQAYGFNLVSNQGSGQTIYIVDAYNDPDISKDLATFDSEFGLSAPPTFTVHEMGSESNSRSWSLEESLDVEWAHAIAPQAKITLVEATSNSNSALYSAVNWATTNGAHIVSMSWGGSDSSGESTYDSYFNHSGVTYIASSGDDKVVEYPSASPYVLSVGGTSLTLNSSGGWGSESAWSSGGGGASKYEAEPTYQKNFGISQSGRATPDVSYDANPSDGFYVADTYYESGDTWWEVGGTSDAAPQWAALIARVDQGLSTPLSTNSLTSRIEYSAAATSSLYSSNYHDITTGSNGHSAGTGYDLVTGIGTPQANNLIGWLIANN